MQLLLACGLIAVPLLALYRTELIGYDAFWHVCVARQDVWSNFWQEVGLTAHPPLFYLCLNAAIALFGSNAFAYRVVSVLATLGPKHVSAHRHAGLGSGNALLLDATVVRDGWTRRME